MDDESEKAKRKPLRAWVEALARSEADVAAGHTVAWPEARARLLASLDELDAEQTSRTA